MNQFLAELPASNRFGHFDVWRGIVGKGQLCYTGLSYKNRPSPAIYGA
jgi:hypothetical protein